MGLLVLAGGLNIPLSPVTATGNAIVVTASESSVVPGADVRLAASMPVSDAGTVSQEIVMQIDPTRARLTSADDVAAPAGWSLSYCSTTCTSPPTNFTATAPTTSAGWQAVKAVRAVGAIDSRGAYQGRQVAARTSTIGRPATGPFASSGSGDGWSVVFDDRGYVFNIFHHNSANLDNVDCRDRNGVSCGPNWPYGAGTGNGATSYVSNGWYDPVHQHLWYDATRQYEVGFECVDVSDIANPQPCGGNVGSTFVSAGISKSPIAGTPNFGSFNTWQTRGIAQIGGRIFSQSDGGATPKVICVDTRANGGLGARCPGSPFDPTPGQASQYIGAVMASGGKLWVTSSNTTPRGGMTCFEPATLAPCAGGWPKTWAMGAAGQLYHLFEVPTAAGGVEGICATTANCYTTQGAALTLNSGLASWYDGVGDAFGYAEHALRQGSRLYRGNGNGAAAGAGVKTISCWDQARSGGNGGVCPNWPISVTNYSIALDPLNDNCLWKNDHQNAIKAYDVTTATENCLTPSNAVVIPAAAAVPRMACASTASGVREWRSLTLLTPTTSGYTAAALTVIDSSGEPISGWIDRPFSAVDGRVIDLSTLSVTTSGQTPSFLVEYTGLSTTANTSVELVAVGDAPELCLDLEGVSTCPVGAVPGAQPNSPANGTFTALADGSAVAGATTVVYDQGSASVAVGAGASAQCGATLVGKAMSNDANTLPVAGATVALLSSTGAALTWPVGHPSAGQPITTTTDANGDYAFPLLAPGTYQVRFVSTATSTIQNARLISSAAGLAATSSFANASGTGAARAAVSPAATIAHGAPGVVNAYFSVPAAAGNDTSSGLSGAAQTISVTANDTAGSGSNLNAPTIRFCAVDSPPTDCTATTKTVAGQGTYALSGTNVVFTPCSAVGVPVGASCTGAFTGAATPIAYRITDSGGSSATATITPTVVAAPTAVDDAQTGPWDTVQSYAPHANDVAGSGAVMAVAPAGICLGTVTVAASCSSTSLTVASQGAYTLNTVTGVVTFDPLPSFSGTATPIKYAAVDSLGQRVLAAITPTVTPPPAPTANPQTRTVSPGGSVAFTTLTGVGGLATTAGPAFDTSATCLVDTSVMPNSCVTSLTIAGEGTYTLHPASGVVTFSASAMITPGTKTPVTYRVTDATGQTATSTLTPVVPTPPTANPDASVNEQNETQVVSVLSNDAAEASTSLVASSLRLCPTGATAPYTSTNCNLSSMSIDDVGRFTVNPNGTVSFEPCTAVAGVTCAGNYNGSPVFAGVTSPVRYVVADAVGQFGSATITFEALPPPVVRPVDDALTRPFATPVVFDPLANDSGGTTAAASGYTSTGSATVNPGTLRLCGTGETTPNCTATTVSTSAGVYVLDTVTGQVTFTPVANFVGTPVGPPSYMVCNQMGGTWAPVTPSTTCSTATLTPTIQPPSTPTATNDAQSGPYNTPLSIAVLANDTKDAALTIPVSSVRLCAGGQLPPNCTATTLTATGEGTYTVDATTGAVTFTPLASFAGTPTLTPTYQFTDSYGAGAWAVITPTIVPPGAPVATPEAKSVLPGRSVDFTNVVGAAALASGTGLRIGASDGPCLVDPADTVCKTSFTISGEGDWTIHQTTGVATFTADPTTTTGAKTSVAYRVTDAVGQTATALLSPSVPPSASLSPDTSTGTQGEAQVVVVLANDTPGTGTTLDPTSVRLCDTGQTVPSCSATRVTVTGEGTYTVNTATGVVTFTPLPAFVGQATPVTYQVTDSMGRTESTTLTVDLDAATVVNPVVPVPTVVSIPPVASPDTIYVARGGSGAFPSIYGPGGLVVRRTGGPALDPASVCMTDPVTTICATTPVVIVRQGTYTLDLATGVVTFTADLAAPVGPQKPIRYRITDAAGNTVHATLTPVVVARPQPNPDTSSGGQGEPQSVSVLTNDRLPANGAPLQPGTVRLCGADEIPPNCTQLRLTVPGEGTYRVESSGDIVFIPLPSFTGQATEITYTVQDAAGQRSASTLRLFVKASDVSSTDVDGAQDSADLDGPSEGDRLPSTGVNPTARVWWLLLLVALGLVLQGRWRPTAEGDGRGGEI